MKYSYKLPLIAVITSALSACGGSGSGSSTTGLGGVVADGYLNGAVVCLDQNRDDSCLGEAISTTSGAGGAYTLDIPVGVDGSAFPIVVEVPKGATDEGEDPGSAADDLSVADSFTLSTPPGKNSFISPLTTLINKIARNSTPEELKRVEDDIKQEMGLSDSAVDLYTNFVAKSKAGNEQSEYTKMFRVAQLLARNFANTEAQLKKNSSAGSADRAAITSLKALEQVSAISGVVSSNSSAFDANKLAEQLKTGWTDAVKDIKTAGDIAKIKNAAKLPRLYDAGTYQYVDKIQNPTIDTPEAKIMFFAKKSDFADWNIQLVNTAGTVMHTFVDADIDGELDILPHLFGFTKRLSSLAHGSYKFIAKPKTGSGDSIELKATSFDIVSVDTTPVTDAESGTELYSKVSNRYDDLRVSVPYGDEALIYGAYIYDAQNKILQYNRSGKGKSMFYFNLKHKDTAKKIAVTAKDAPAWSDTNMAFKYLDRAVVPSQSKVIVEWTSANFYNSSVDTVSPYKSIDFGFGFEGSTNTDNLPISSFVLEQFVTGAYVDRAVCTPITTTEPEFNCSPSVAETYADPDGSGANYASFSYSFENVRPTMAFPTGNYRLRVIDSLNNTDASFVNLGIEDTTAKAIGMKISDLTIDTVAQATADGWVDAKVANIEDGYFYSANFRVEYTRIKNGVTESRATSIVNSPKSSNGEIIYQLALLKSKTIDKIASLKKKGYVPKKVIVRLSVSDGLKSGNINNTWRTQPKDTGYFSELF